MFRIRTLCFIGTAIFSILSLSLPLSAQRLSVHASIDAGGPAVGADYQLPDTATESYGVFTRFHSKDEGDKAPGLFVLGAFFKTSTQQGPYEFFLSPGFAAMHYDLFNTSFIAGPTLQYGLTASLDAHLGIGVSNQKLYSWLGEVQGLISDAFMVHLTYRME
jgi:hypothetical protein